MQRYYKKLKNKNSFKVYYQYYINFKRDKIVEKFLKIRKGVLT